MLPVIPNTAKPRNQARPGGRAVRSAERVREKPDKPMLEELLKEQREALREAERVYEEHRGGLPERSPGGPDDPRVLLQQQQLLQHQQHQQPQLQQLQQQQQLQLLPLSPSIPPREDLFADESPPAKLTPHVSLSVVRREVEIRDLPTNTEPLPHLQPRLSMGATESFCQETDTSPPLTPTALELSKRVSAVSGMSRLSVCLADVESEARLREEQELLGYLTSIEEATKQMRRLNERMYNWGQRKRFKDASTQYCEQDFNPLVTAPSQNLLGFHRIPARVHRSKSDIEHKDNIHQILTRGYEDPQGKLGITPALYMLLLQMYDLQHDLKALCLKLSEALSQCIDCNVVVFTCMGTEIVKMGAREKHYDISRGIVGHVATSKAALRLTEPWKHSAYDAEVDECVIKDALYYYFPLRWASKVSGVVQLFTRAKPVAAELSCVATILLYAASLMMLHHPDLAKMEINANILTAVGDLATNMFEDDKLVERIMESSKMLLKAERCALFHVDEGAQQLVSRIEDEEVRISINSGIAGFVAVSGKGQNIPNAYSDPRFNRNVDKRTGFHTRQIMCMPLKCDGKVIAVAQLVNKHENIPFSRFDEKVFETYSTFAAVALRNCQIFKKANRSNEYNTVLLDLASELGKVTLDDSVLKEKVIEYATKLVKADRGALFYADWENSVLTGTVDGRVIDLPINAGIAGAVALSGTKMNISDAYADARFNKEVDQITGYTTETILSCPIKYAGQVIAVAQLINKKKHGQKRQVFTQQDEVILENFGVLAGIAIRTAQQYRLETRGKDDFCSMLSAVANMSEFDIRGELQQICERIVADSIMLVKCECVNVYLLENSILDEQPYVSNVPPDDRVYNARVAEEVAKTCEVVLLQSPRDSHLYSPHMDQAKSHRTKDILAMPISCERRTLCRSDKDTVLAVVEFINKDEGLFSDSDVSRLSYYLNLCAFTMKNTRLLAFEKQNRKGAMELLSHTNKQKMSVPRGSSPDIEHLSDHDKANVDAASSSIDKDLLRSFAFDSSALEDDGDQVAHLLYMFTSLSLLAPLGIEERVMVNFIFCIKKKYQSVPYHNFIHAIDVTQAVYAMLHMMGDSLGHFSDVEKFVVLICAICHDVDHMGVNNSFHYGSETPLGILSNATGSSSPLEVHHLNVMFSVMQRPGCEILAGLGHDAQTEALKMAIQLVLATDMAKHGECVKDLKNMKYNPTNAFHRHLALVALLKFADISNQARPFAVGQKWASKIMEEFHCQGDVEKERFGHVSTAWFDRDTSEVPKIQADFIQYVCEPFMQDIETHLFPGLSPLRTSLQENKGKWLRLAAEGQKTATPPVSPSITVERPTNQVPVEKE